MPATPFDSALYSGLFQHREVAQLFTDSAEVRAMLIVEGALAKAQGARGEIPETAAEIIHRASLDVVIDPAALAQGTATNAVPVPALVQAFRASIADPAARPYVHWGATSQDIVDTALALRLRRATALLRSDLLTTIGALSGLAEDHAETPMAGRTWGLVATPSTFGALVASWGFPLVRLLERLDAILPRLLCVSLSGAAGTGSALGPQVQQLREDLATALGLADPGQSWHATRDAQAEFAGWMAGLTGSLSKMGEDVLSMVRSGEGTLIGAGASSTMPQKQNPVAPSLLVALARQTAALNGAVLSAMPHRDQRDASAWLVEWLSLPQMVLATAQAVATAARLSGQVQPNVSAMAKGIDPDGLGLIHAEALQFCLAQQMPRPDAQARVKELCRDARETGTPLLSLAALEFPNAGVGTLADPANTLGQAPAEAHRFAKEARNLSKD